MEAFDADVQHRNRLPVTRSAWRRVFCRCSANRARLARPVRPSWRASWRAVFGRVGAGGMSLIEPAITRGDRCGSWTAIPQVRIQR